MPDDDADDAALDAEIEAALTAADADADGVPKLGWRAWARSKLGRAADTSQLPETVAGPPPLVIADLLAQHAEKVAAVRAAMPSATAHYDPTQHDDLWCLRFLLSHKLEPSRAVAAMAASLELRHSMGLDEVGVHVRTWPPERWPAWDAFCIQSGGHQSQTRQTPQSHFGHFGLSNFERSTSNVPQATPGSGGMRGAFESIN